MENPERTFSTTAIMFFFLFPLFIFVFIILDGFIRVMNLTLKLEQFFSVDTIMTQRAQARADIGILTWTLESGRDFLIVQTGGDACFRRVGSRLLG